MAELERSILSSWARHRRFAGRGALVLAGAGIAGFAGALAAPGGDTTIVQPVRQETHLVEVAVPVAVPAPAPEPPIVEADEPFECPKPPAFIEGKPAGRALSAEHEAYDYLLDEAALIGIAASPNRPELVATWSEDAIYVSFDDGRRFERVLDGPGRVADVAFDCHDRVYAWRTGLGLGVRDVAGESWRPLDPFDGKTLDEAHRDWGKRVVLAVRGDTVALGGPAKDRGDHGLVAITRDRGVSWRFNDLGYYDRFAGLALEDDGTAYAVTDWSDCMIDGSSATTIPRDLAAPTTDELGYYGASTVTADRTIYTRGADCGADLCVRGPNDTAWHRVTGLPKTIEAISLVPGASRPHVAAADRIYRLTGRRATRLAKMPDTVDLVDATNRALWIDDHGLLHRWSPRHGDRLLLGQRLSN